MELLALLAALGLVALNAFFVATEFAIVKVRATRIEELARKGRPGAASVRHLTRHIDAYLSATQLGITLASLGLGWIGEPAFAHLMERPLALVGVVDPVWVHRLALATAFVIITSLHITLGEQAPKSMAILRAEGVALAVSYPMRVFYTVFYPAIWLLNSAALLALRMVGLSFRNAPGDHHSEEEIKIILSQARSAGLLAPARAELLTKAMSLPSKTANHLMVPRSEVVLLDANLSFDENVERAMSAGHTHYPLCDRELDDVIGIIDIRKALYNHHTKGDTDLRVMAKPASYVPEMMSAERLMEEFRARRTTMAIVVDEYGGASGIVTADDVVTAVMGEVEPEESDVVTLPGGVYEVDGIATIEEVGEALKVSLPTESMRTLAGFLMERLGRMPRSGDRVVEQGYSFQVTDVKGPRVGTVRIQRQGADGRTAAVPAAHGAAAAATAPAGATASASTTPASHSASPPASAAEKAVASAAPQTPATGASSPTRR